MSETMELKVEDIKADVEGSFKCPVRKSLHYVSGFLSGPMCGKCFPCSMGTYEARIRLQRIVDGDGAEADLAALKRIATQMVEASMCKKGKDTARFMLDWMGTDVFLEHINGRCPDAECPAFMMYHIIPEKCTMCDLCREACKHNAILGEKRKPFQSNYQPFEIRKKRCDKCGECINVCPEGAIIITETKQVEAEVKS